MSALSELNILQMEGWIRQITLQQLNTNMTSSMAMQLFFK